jgi:hypothetical protein
LRNGDAKRFRGLEIDDQLEFCRRLHRHVGGLFALEDAIDIPRSPPLRIVGNWARMRSSRRLRRNSGRDTP